MEYYFGPIGVLTAYILGGIEGGMITCFFSKGYELFTTPNDGLFGFFGLLIGFVILNWESL